MKTFELKTFEGSFCRSAWRIVVGLSLVPAFGTLYQRLTLAESERFKASRLAKDEDEESYVEKMAPKGQPVKLTGVAEEKNIDFGNEPAGNDSLAGNITASTVVPTETRSSEPGSASGLGAKGAMKRRQSHLKEFIVYFSEWRHAKILIGTCSCWFLLDIA